jgi:hypothetical protein
MYVSMLLGTIFFLLMGLLGPGGFQAVAVPGISAFGILVLCYLLVTVAVSRGVYLAIESQTRVWLTIPWSFWRSKQENLAGVLFQFGLNPLWLLSLFLVLQCSGLLNPQGVVLVLVNVYVYSLVIGFTGFLILNRFAVEERFLAATPFDCWDCDDLGELMIAEMSSSRRAKLLMQLKRTLTQTTS